MSEPTVPGGRLSTEQEEAMKAASAVVVGAMKSMGKAFDTGPFGVPDSGLIFLPGDTVNITRPDGTTQRYEVTKGDDPGTVWVDPNGPRQFEMRRIEVDDA